MGTRSALKRCVGSDYSRDDVNELVKACYKLALAYLRIKASSKKSYLLREEKLEDLAWDFIADLFQKDKNGKLIILKSYFHDKPVSKFSEDEINIELRKLVFTKVDDNIFRLYGEKDPSLRKIIRNIKLAIRDTDCKNRVCYRDGNLIVCDKRDSDKPTLPVAFMRIRLCSRLNEKSQIPDVLIEVIDIITEHKEYRQRFSLVALAKIIRESFVIVQNDERNGKASPIAEKRIFKNEFDSFLNSSAGKVKESLGNKYVEKGKLQSEELEPFFKAASDIIREDFRTEINGYSQYEQLSRHMGGLEYSHFREKHRQVLEYVVKLIREDLVRNFKKEWARF